MLAKKAIEMSAYFAYGAIGWRLPLCQVAREIANLGFKGIEVFGLLEPLQEDRDFGNVLTQIGIRVSAGYFAGSFIEKNRLGNEYATFDRTLGEIKRLGGQVVVVAGGRVIPESRRENWKTFVQTVCRLGEMAARANIQLVFHPHVGTLVSSPDEIELLANETDPQTIKFAFDTAHLARCKGDPVALFKRFVSRIGCVHFKDLKDDDFVPLGRGILDFQGVYRALEDHLYSGWITVELDSWPDPKTAAVENLKYLRATLGVRI
jgi:inosose dehydratase